MLKDGRKDIFADQIGTTDIERSTDFITCIIDLLVQFCQIGKSALSISYEYFSLYGKRNTFGAADHKTTAKFFLELTDLIA